MENKELIQQAIVKLHEEISNIDDYFNEYEVYRVLSNMDRIDLDKVADDFVDEVWDAPVRRCSHCGKLMDEGYMICEQYACSDECRNAIYKEIEEVETDEDAEKHYLCDCYNLNYNDIKDKTIEQIETDCEGLEISDYAMWTQWW